MTTDNILLHTLKVIALTTESSLVEHLSCLLEGSSTHEALRTEGSTCNTLKNLGSSCLNGITHLNEFEVTTLKA